MCSLASHMSLISQINLLKEKVKEFEAESSGKGIIMCFQYDVQACFGLH